MINLGKVEQTQLHVFWICNLNPDSIQCSFNTKLLNDQFKQYICNKIMAGGRSLQNLVEQGKHRFLYTCMYMPIDKPWGFLLKNVVDKNQIKIIVVDIWTKPK